MEETVGFSIGHFAGPIGPQKPLDTDGYHTQLLNTPKKGSLEVEFSQWNMWADEMSRSNPAVRWTSLIPIARFWKLHSIPFPSRYCFHATYVAATRFAGSSL